MCGTILPTILKAWKSCRAAIREPTVLCRRQGQVWANISAPRDVRVDPCEKFNAFPATIGRDVRQLDGRAGETGRRIRNDRLS